MHPAGMATAAATAQPEQPADDAALRATLSHKSQQRRAQKLAKHRPRGDCCHQLYAGFACVQPVSNEHLQVMIMFALTTELIH